MDNGGEIVSTGNRDLAYCQDWEAESHASIFNLLLCVFLEQVVFWSFIIDDLMFVIEPHYQEIYDWYIIDLIERGPIRLLCNLSEAWK